MSGVPEGARLATLDDRQWINEIDRSLRIEKADQRGGNLLLRREARRTADNRFDQLIGRAGRQPGDAVVVVGTYDEHVFGYAIAEIEPLADGALIGRIDDLSVLEPARAVGIGAAMMNLLLDEFRAAGCEGADARALPGDRHTKNFFESFGLKARMLTVHTTL